MAAFPALLPVVDDGPVVWWSDHHVRSAVNEAQITVTGECDPWHMLAQATCLVIDAEDEVSQIADLLELPVYRLDPATGAFELRKSDRLPELASAEFVNPFTNELMSAHEAIELCGFWRQLIDSNRELLGGIGFAFWKRGNVQPLLWGGGRPFEFFRSAVEIKGSDGRIAVWRSKAADLASALESEGFDLVEVEDGFLRSHGLGANCVPPLSVTVDRLAAHFDPSRASELENLIQNGPFDDDVIERARRLRRTIIVSGLSKYGRGETSVDRPAGERRHILVPGQVEDDRSVQLGGCGLTTNLELLRRVRAQAPDAYILYKPHPDVLAGHRIGEVAEQDCVQFADQIVADEPISSLIAMVDEVHVNTSLAGFEALMRDKVVTTYGVPFYAGWGLTNDLGPVPARRTAKRSIDELVAATLLLYPRYLDPLTGLPCPPEVVVSRLSSKGLPETGLVVGMRRLQGKLKRSVRSLA